MLYNLCVTLFSHFLNDVSVGAHNHQSRPIVQFKSIPDIKLAVIDARVLHIVPDDGLSQNMRSLLTIEFGTVHADERNLWEVFELFFKFLEFGQNVDAVDAAASPEVYDKNLTLQMLLHGERLIIECIQPFEVVALA